MFPQDPHLILAPQNRDELFSLKVTVEKKDPKPKDPKEIRVFLWQNPGNNCASVRKDEMVLHGRMTTFLAATGVLTEKYNFSAGVCLDWSTDLDAKVWTFEAHHPIGPCRPRVPSIA